MSSPQSEVSQAPWRFYALAARVLVGGLFIATAILKIENPATFAEELGMPPGTMKIRIDHTFLEVDEATGIIWQVDGDIQDMFFRRGVSEKGENAAYWFLIEWRDIPGGSTAPRARILESGGEVAVPRVSWGQIKARYEN